MLDYNFSIMHMNYKFRSRIAWAVAIVSALYLADRFSDSFGETTPGNAATLGAVVALLSVWMIRWIFSVYEQNRRRGKIVFEIPVPEFALIAKRIGSGIAIVFAVLVGFHLITTGDMGGAFRMTTTDIKVAAHCPHKPATVSAFIARSYIDSLDVGLASDRGINVPKRVCEQGWPL